MKRKDFKKIRIVFFAVILLAVMLAGNASAVVRHCYDDVTLDAGGISFNLSWSLNGKQYPVGQEADNTFTVPPGISLSLTSISTFTYVCENQAQAEVPVPLRVKITKPDGIQETVRNVECVSGTTFCDGSGQACDSLDPYFVATFTMPGTYTLAVEFMQKPGSSLLDVPENWLPYATYKVKIFTAAVAIANPPNRTLLFDEAEETKTINSIYWTVYNLSQGDITLANVNFTGCSEILDCGFQNFAVDEYGNAIPINIPAGENFVLFGIIKAKNPEKQGLANPAIKTISIDVNYSDAFGGKALQKASNKTTLTLVLADLEKFNVKLASGKENVCIGRNRMIGYTGKTALPKLKFAWNWNSITINDCDLKSTTDLNYIYCDATQFSTEVLKKLKRIEDLRKSAGSGNIAQEIFSLQHFRAFLVKDSFNQDFQQDFSRFALQQFFESPEWFARDIEGFKTIFSNPQYFKFTGPAGANPVLPFPGFYQVDIDLNFLDLASNDYFLAGEPNVVVTVKLTPLSTAPDNNPMYYVPLDGFVGFEDNKQKIEREGYGTTYTGFTVFVNKAGESPENRVAIQQPSNSSSQTALATVSASLIDDFDALNNSKRGSILVLEANPETSPGNVTLYYLESAATPILIKMKDESVLGQDLARAFYYLKQASNGASSIVSSAESFLNVWTVSSSSIKSAENICLDFAKNKLFYDRKDSKASAFSNSASCSIPASITAEKAFGFAFDTAPKNSFMYLQTTFYTPKSKTFELLDACTDAKASFITPHYSIIPGGGTGTLIPLDYTSNPAVASSYNIESIENVFELVKEEKVCVTSSAGAIDFWWNPKHFTQELENSISDAQFTGNKCNIAAAVQG